jgi:hypothetical protein|tara:strand:- start:632 stop:1459 length:828 start_codon:yes stop_codon:yes gene_type:complete
MKLKHNKKRNTAFVYEALVREVAKAVVKRDDNRKSLIIKIMKEHFSPTNILAKELQLYKALEETKGLDVYTAERLIKEARTDHQKLNKNEIFENQTSLINIINKRLTSEVFSNFVPNYKNLATIAQVFGDDVATKERVLLERKLLGDMVRKEGAPAKSKNMPHIDGLVYKTFVKKFNEKYDKELLPEQKQLLNHFLTSFTDNGVEFKMFLSEEVGRLKNSIAGALKENNSDIDNDMIDKTKLVLEKLEEFKKTKIDESMVKGVLKIQSLAYEVLS